MRYKLQCLHSKQTQIDGVSRCFYNFREEGFQLASITHLSRQLLLKNLALSKDCLHLTRPHSRCIMTAQIHARSLTLFERWLHTPPSLCLHLSLSARYEELKSVAMRPFSPSLNDQSCTSANRIRLHEHVRNCTDKQTIRIYNECGNTWCVNISCLGLQFVYTKHLHQEFL